MFKNWRKRKKEWKENVKINTEKATAEFLTKLFQRCGFYTVSEKFLNWANSNRKSMFAITMSFLIFVFIFSIITRPKVNSGDFEKMKQKVSNKEIVHKSNYGVKELIQVLRLKEELNSIDSSHLSKEDSIKILDLYNKLKNQDYETN